jgi:trimethylamine--corrinoid protein Co-methyltransferase
MAKIAFGAEFLKDHTVITSLINANSPMTWDGTMLGALKVYARNNQACIVTPFILSGAMSPVTAAGTLSQVLAEVLSGAATTQLVRPGAPVLFGVFASSMSMQSGAPTFGTPEPSLVSLAAGQLARRLGIPFRTGGSLCGSKIADAQAAYESAQTLIPTLFAGTNFVLHAAGWLEGGLASGYEKFVMDADQLGIMQVMSGNIDLSENGQAMDAIREVGARAVGANRHFLECAHTNRNFETAFYRSSIADNNSYEQWESEGAQDALKRANTLWKKMLSEYEAPAIDPGVDEALQEFIAKKKAAVPDSNV